MAPCCEIREHSILGITKNWGQTALGNSPSRFDTIIPPVDGAEETFEWLRTRDVKVPLSIGFDRAIAA